MVSGGSWRHGPGGESELFLATRSKYKDTTETYGTGAHARAPSTSFPEHCKTMAAFNFSQRRQWRTVAADVLHASEFVIRSLRLKLCHVRRARRP